MKRYRLSESAEYLFNYAGEDLGFWFRDTFTSTPYRSFGSLLGLIIVGTVVLFIVNPPKRGGER